MIEAEDRYSGRNPEPTEKESGDAIQEARRGPIKRHSAGHLVLYQFRSRAPMTAYEASRRACGDWHGKRREATRLVERGFLQECGVLPNEAPLGRPHVKAFVITESGFEELIRLGREQ